MRKAVRPSVVAGQCLGVLAGVQTAAYESDRAQN